MNYHFLSRPENKAMNDGCESFNSCQTYDEQLNWLKNQKNLETGYGSKLFCTNKGNPAWLGWDGDQDGDFEFENFLTTKSGDEVRKDLKEIGFNNFI